MLFGIRTCVRMEIACVIDKRLVLLANSPRPGRGGGPLPGRADLAAPVAAAEATEAMMQALEKLGAAVESERAAEAFFAVDLLCRLYGGDSAGVLAADRPARGGGGSAAATPRPTSRRPDGRWGSSGGSPPAALASPLPSEPPSGPAWA